MWHALERRDLCRILWKTWRKDNIVIYSVKHNTHYTHWQSTLKIWRHVSAHLATIRPITKHSTGAFSECTHFGIPYCLQNWLNKLQHYCKTQRDGSYQNKKMKERDCLEDLCLIGKQILQQIFIKYDKWCVLNSSESEQIPLMIRCLTGTELLGPLQRDEILDWLRQ
jgi:hypothetical protein